MEKDRCNAVYSLSIYRHYDDKDTKLALRILSSSYGIWTYIIIINIGIHKNIYLDTVTRTRMDWNLYYRTLLDITTVNFDIESHISYYANRIVTLWE